jgi:amylosucrase
MDREARRSLERILPRLRDHAAQFDPVVWRPFEARLEAHFETLFGLLRHLYGSQYDFFYHLETILDTAARMWLARPPELQALDLSCEADPLWFQSHEMLGGVCYVDLFAGDLAGLRARIPYFQELGLTYLHLMPLFLSPEVNDGGYAVSSYHHVGPALGTMQELAELAAKLRRCGIRLVLDLVFNHTSDEHDWARRALAGDQDYQEYYLMFPDRGMPDAYDAHLREIFPDVRRGSFTYRPEIDRWVWTTFHSYQWDLNYRNPAVFNRMDEEMLFLANMGAQVLRLDAVAFIWKQMGTSCENLPEAHLLIQAFNAIARIAAPTLLFKSEAIVHPDDVARYIAPHECQLSYNPLLMALLWEALATRQVRLLQRSMQKRFHISPQCAWVNYVRCHDDIGWTFSDEDAAELGIQRFDHRRFLNAFYTGQFEGSFARGLPFQFNPVTQDMRISGTCASLAGLEKALRQETNAQAELAVRRILLLHSVILSIGGIPLIYLGDEVGTLNDYGYRSDPVKATDSRWVHRPAADRQQFAQGAGGRTMACGDPGPTHGQICARLRRLIEVRRQTPALGWGRTEILETGNPHILGYVRQSEGQRILILASFAESEQRVPANELRTYGLGYTFIDLATGRPVSADEELVLDAYRFVWLLTT